jgi:predicted helicase
LDPATGTATFLVEVIDVIHRTMVAKWKRLGLSEPQQRVSWNDYVPKHLLPRLHAYELMMAPYAIAHMKIGLKLAETGYRFATDERARIYLTNALEPWVKQLPLIGFEALAHEAAAVNDVKRTTRFTVVIGNPPYSGVSANMTETIMELVEPYKSINGVSLGERKIWAQDDYKKFIRFGQLTISHAGSGILGFITNHGFISEPTSRGMRHNLLSTFSRVSVLDLHGSLKKREVCPDGSPDKNVFDIEPGLAIAFFRRGGTGPVSVTHRDLWGLRDVNYDFLRQNTLSSTGSIAASPTAEFYLFIPQSDDAKVEFSRLVSITEVFQSGSNGIQTSRDHVVYGFSKSECHAIIEEFRAPEGAVPTSELRDKYWPGKKVGSYAAGDTRGWRVAEARNELRKDNAWEAKFKKSLYRPFDFRTLFYSELMIDWPRTEIMSQMLRPNLSLCVGRAGSAADNQDWNVIFVANTLVDMNLFYRGGNVNFPLRIAPSLGSLALDKSPRPNFTASFLKAVSRRLHLPQTGDFGLPQDLNPEDLFHYAYAIFHSPGYRRRFAEFLKIDFPRLPLTDNLGLFRALAKLGGQLTALHVLDSPKIDQAITEFVGDRNLEVEKVSWTTDVVWLDKAQTTGFKGVREKVWNFHIGGYRVCEKWLKDRKGRRLLKADIDHYHKIIVALHETLRLMEEIDVVIEQEGGWPDAFAGTETGYEGKTPPLRKVAEQEQKYLFEDNDGP